MKKIINKKMSKLGKAGAKKRFAKRYEVLVELSKIVDKQYQNYLLKWPTEHLIRLLNAYKDKGSKLNETR